MGIEEYKITKFKAVRGHDGQGFNATLSRNGKAVCLVDDDGWGGGYTYEWLDRKDGTKEYPAVNYAGESFQRRMTAEEHAFNEAFKGMQYRFQYDNSLQNHSEDTIIGTLIEEYDLNKKAQKKTLFKVDGEPGWRYITAPYSPKVEAFLVQKYGEKLLAILNRDGYWKGEALKVV